MMTSYCSRRCFNRTFSQFFVVGALAAIGLLSGLTPEYSRDSQSFVFSSAAYAQEVSAEEITRYARAVLAMEPLRQQAYSEIKLIIGSGNIPDIVCGRPASITALPAGAQTIARNYCNQSSAIVANFFPRGKTGRFNEITNLMQRNQGLHAQIQSELRRLQQ